MDAAAEVKSRKKGAARKQFVFRLSLISGKKEFSFVIPPYSLGGRLARALAPQEWRHRVTTRLSVILLCGGQIFVDRRARRKCQMT